MMLPCSSDDILAPLHRSRPLTRLMVLGIFGYFLSLPLVERGISQNDTGIVLGWLGFAFFLEAILAVSALLLARQTQNMNARPLAWSGAFLILAGIWSDVLATVFSTPDMAREANAIIIFLRENRFPLWVQYATGFTAQFLLTVISCALWVAFVHHLPRYRAVLLAMRPQSLVEFLWASLGGSTYFVKMHRLNISRSYRFIWWLILPLVVPFDRFWLALEWLQVVPVLPSLRGLVTFLQTLFPLVLLASWLLYVYFEQRDVLRSDPSFARHANQANLKTALIRFSIAIIGTCMLACFSGLTCLWATREPEFLEVRLENAPETVTLNTPFPITFLIENRGEQEALISRIKTTSWDSNETTVSEKLIFVLSNPPLRSTTEGPRTTLEYENTVLAPGETLRVELWFAGLQAGRVLLKTSVYSGLREKSAPSVFIQILSP